MPLFTSEAVTNGHPDKVCDQISDAVLDAVLEQDPYGRVAVETFATQDVVHVGGELTTTAQIDIEAIVRETLRDIGYSARWGFDPDAVKVQVTVGEQSPDIAAGVSTALEVRAGGGDDLGAGDQGMMFGYATAELPALFMPAPLYFAREIAQDLRRTGSDQLGPDGKAQVTVEYDETGRPCAIRHVVVSIQHDEHLTEAQLDELVTTRVLAPVLDRAYACGIDAHEAQVLINPSGRFVKGGPAADAGLTGRKIIVDTYGGMARHGGGAFSGKDPSKVDRSGAYAMREVAVAVVAAGLAKRCEVQVAYAIGVASPVSLHVETFGTGRVPDEKIVEAINEVFDLRPAAIIERLGLRAPQYREAAAWGHMGHLFRWDVPATVDIESLARVARA